MAYIAVLDIGKSHVKLTVCNHAGDIQEQVRRPNVSLAGRAYTCFDTDGIWDWLMDGLGQLAARWQIERLSIATHGGSCALVDPRTGDLHRPVLDYEWDGYPDTLDYDSQRPNFAESLSPLLPAGLNLGRQLAFLLPTLGKEERDNLLVLLYPNYWAFRLTGVPSTDLSSLGCHSDLWNVGTASFSALGERLGLDAVMPAVKPPMQPLATITDEVARRTGLSPSCTVWPGIHDSNASYAPWLKLPSNARPAVISTGTWCIVFDGQADLSRLAEAKDMLANIDASGSPLPTARFMGGREFEAICAEYGSAVSGPCELAEVAGIIDEGLMALPSFAPGTGPFGTRAASLPLSVPNGKALATLYCALNIDRMLSLLASARDVVIEGPFAENNLLTRILAQLRPGQRIFKQPRSSGVVAGCVALTRWDDTPPPAQGTEVPPAQLPGLLDYATEWNRLADLES